MSVEIVMAVADAWDEWWDDELHKRIGANCCVLTARVAIKTLAALGVKAWPLATETVIYNHAGAALWQAKVPIEQWPEHAWSVGALRSSPTTDNGYAGHIWAATDEWVVDLSARQFHRPGRIEISTALVATNTPLPNGDYCWAFPGAVIIAHPFTDRSFVNGPDWLRNWRDFTPELIERTTAKLVSV